MFLQQSSAADVHWQYFSFVLVWHSTWKKECMYDPNWQTPPFQHCFHMGNLDSDWDYLFIFRYKYRQLPDAQCHVNMACTQWLETWDVAIIYTGGTRICVTFQWMSVDCMILSPAKLKLIWTAAVSGGGVGVGVGWGWVGGWGWGGGGWVGGGGGLFECFFKQKSWWCMW